MSPQPPDEPVRLRLKCPDAEDFVERDGRLAGNVGFSAGRVHDQDPADCSPLTISPAEKLVLVTEDQEPMVQFAQP